MRRHLAILVLLAAGAALRVLVWVGFPPALYFLGDSIGYLQEGVNPFPRIDRPSGYGVFLWFLHPLHRLVAVTAVQHVLGELVGLLCYLVARALGLPPWLAALAAAPVLLDGYELSLEQTIASETLFISLAAAGLALALFAGRRLPWLAVVVAGLCLGLATLVRTLGEALIVIGLAAVVWQTWLAAGWRRAVLASAAFALAAAVPVVAYAQWFDSYYGRHELAAFSGLSLYAQIMPTASCEGIELTPHESLLCDTRPPAERPGPLGYAFNPASPFYARLVAGLRPAAGSQDRAIVAADAIASSFDRKLILHQPAVLAGVVGGYLADLFRWSPRYSFMEKDYYRFQSSYPFDAPVEPMVTAYQGRKVPQIIHPAAGLVRPLAAYQAYVYLPGTLYAVLIALGLVAGGWFRRREAIAAAIYALAALACLGIAAFFGSDPRYRLPALALAPLAGTIGAWVIWRSRAAVVADRPRTTP